MWIYSDATLACVSACRFSRVRPLNDRPSYPGSTCRPEVAAGTARRAVNTAPTHVRIRPAGGVGRGISGGGSSSGEVKFQRPPHPPSVCPVAAAHPFSGLTMGPAAKPSRPQAVLMGIRPVQGPGVLSPAVHYWCYHGAHSGLGEIDRFSSVGRRQSVVADSHS